MAKYGTFKYLEAKYGITQENVNILDIQDYLNALENNVRKPIIKIEFLRYDDETPYAEITGDLINGSGNLTVNNVNGVRRAVDFSLINVSGDYIPSPDTIWLRQKIKLYLGLNIDDSDFFIEQGVFVLDDPASISNFSEKRLDIKAIDKFSLLDGSLGGEIDANYIIPAGTNILSAIKAVLQPSTDALKEVVYDPILPVLDIAFASITTPYSIEKSAGDTMGDIIIELAEMVSANVYYNEHGQLVFEQDFKDNIKGSLYDFSTEEFNYGGSTITYKFNKVYNAVKVIGDNVNGATYTATVENNNLQSPTSIPNVKFMRIKVITDTNIYSNALAQTRAEYELKRLTNLLNEISITSVPMYHLDVDKVITLTDSSQGLDRYRYLINSISIPLSTGGSMTVTCARSVDEGVV